MTYEAIDSDRLHAALERMFAAFVIVEALPSGTTGPSFLIETGSGRCVAKLFSADSHALLGPAAQFALLETLEPAGIAPRPVGCDEARGVLVAEYLDGAVPLTSDELREVARIDELAAVLRQLHSARADLPEFRPADFAAKYVDAIGGRDALATRDRSRYSELLELAQALDPAPLVPCHNDLLAENLLYDGAMRLIDFDYAVLAPPIVDLASLAGLNDFTDDQVSHLIAAYFGGENQYRAGDFARVRRLLRLVAHFWSLASKDAGAASITRYRIENG